MRALVLTDTGPRVRDDVPDPTREGEALVRMTLAGVCATDLELAKGYMGFRGVMGHEWVGVVEAAPDPSWVGRRVVGEINCACGDCPTCAAMRPTHCPRRTVLGIAGRDGAFAERFSIPQENLLPVPEGVSDEAAVFVEPLAAACEILEQVHVRPSTRAVVLGVGRLGQLCARVLALAGADVTAVSRRPEGLARLPRGLPGLLAQDAERVAGADLVVDTSGSPEGLGLARSLLRPRGTLVLKTTVHAPTGLEPTSLVLDEITVVGSRCGPFGPALRLLERGALDPRDLVTSRLPLSDGARALELADAPDQVKVLLAP